MVVACPLIQLWKVCWLVLVESLQHSVLLSVYNSRCISVVKAAQLV